MRPLRHPLRALSLTLGAALPIAACGPAEVHSRDAAAPAEEEEIPEGMEDWAYLRGHTSPFESETEWDGDVDGFKTEWHPNGVKSGEGEYRHSKRVGPWTFWHANGQKRWQGTYAANVPAGLERAWYEDGTPNYEGTYRNGLRHGTFSYWYPNGRLWWKGSFEDGAREGVYVKWNADGTPDREESGLYQDGVKVGELDLADHADDTAGP